MNHPSWQQKLREHQAKYDAQLAAARAQREAEEQEKLLKKVNEFRADMAVIGLDLPESDTGEWMLDGFKMSMHQSVTYASRLDLWIGMNAEVSFPFDLDEEDHYELFERGYVSNVYRVVKISTSNLIETAAEIARAFDDLPMEAQLAREKNMQIAIDYVAIIDETEVDLSEVESSAGMARHAPTDGETIAPVNGHEALLVEVVGYIREIAEAARKLSAVNHG